MELMQIVLGELGTNCYLLECGEGEVCAFDIGNGVKKFMHVLQAHDLKLKAIFLTHGHYDHIAGVEAVRNMAGADVYIHEKDAVMLEDGNANLCYDITDEEFIPIKKYQTVTDGQILKAGNREIQVMHTPGHTPGGVCYLTGNFLFSGDTLFYKSIGRTDFIHGNPEDMQKSLQKIAALQQNYDICPGHFYRTTLDFEKNNNPYLRNLK